MDCTFCDLRQFAPYLVGERRGFWIIADIGQVTDGGHLLVVPRRHIVCAAEMERSAVKDLGFTIRDVVTALCRELNTPLYTIFEHGIAGQSVKHAHVHVLPGDVALGETARADFPECEIERLGGFLGLWGAYQLSPRPYLFWSEADALCVCWDPPAPPQYLRHAAARSLGRPERADWRGVDRGVAEHWVAETRARFAPYFTV